MRVIRAEARFEGSPDGKAILRIIESAGRVCYKSEDKITDDSAEAFVRRLIRSGHESVLEHASLRARIICDRGVSHELVRHRLASYSQESTRYCNYSQGKHGHEITVIEPAWLASEAAGHNARVVWWSAMVSAEQAYFHLLDLGWTPQQARSVLPNSLKTEVVMTANIREWRHFFQLRCSKAAHPQMQEVAAQLLAQAAQIAPALFEDIIEDLREEG